MRQLSKRIQVNQKIELYFYVATGCVQHLKFT